MEADGSISVIRQESQTNSIPKQDEQKVSGNF
jgi:uncharacterized membrane protein YcaP (DUF421 family)